MVPNRLNAGHPSWCTLENTGIQRGEAAVAQLFVFHAALELGTAAAERLIDGLGTGGQAALEGGEGEAHSAPTAAVFESVGAIHLLAHIAGHGFIEGRFHLGELVVHRRREARREERRTVKLHKLFLHHAAHEVGDIHLVRALAELAVETV